MGMDLGGPQAETAAKFCVAIVLVAVFFIGFTLGFAACVFL